MRSALESVDGVTDIETNIGDNTCSFSAPADMDVAAVLDKFADEGNKHIAGWSKAGDAEADKSDEAEPAKKDDAAATSNTTGSQTVSLKLPGMT